MGRYGGSFFSAVANTSHCKSQAGSREPQRVLCTRRSVQEDSQSPLLLHTADHLPSPLCSLKKPTANRLVIKNQNSGVLSAPLLLLNVGSVDGAADASPFSNKVHSKTLSVYVAAAWLTPTAQSLNKKTDLRECPCLVIPLLSAPPGLTPCINSCMHTMHISHHHLV